MRGTWRAATLKKARQRAVEAQTQKISKIVMGPYAVFIVPCINNFLSSTLLPRRSSTIGARQDCSAGRSPECSPGESPGPRVGTCADSHFGRCRFDMGARSISGAQHDPGLAQPRHVSNRSKLAEARRNISSRFARGLTARSTQPQSAQVAYALCSVWVGKPRWDVHTSQNTDVSAKCACLEASWRAAGRPVASRENDTVELSPLLSPNRPGSGLYLRRCRLTVGAKGEHE
jgi:hypothetical protein